jgi:isoleucyl-tRNA synthetase
MKAAGSDVSLPRLEHEVLAAWEKEKTFQLSVARRATSPEFAFYDGPPFANGLPHYGHLLANTLKDTVPRYWTMRGFKVERRFGWDCHGLPVEYEIEKRDKLKGRTDILAMGVAKFNEECRASVLHYAQEWEKTITRLGRWVDWKNQYRTMDKSFMESVWWVFSQLHAKGLVYRDYKVVPYSPRITAVLSNFEANQNYKDVQDPAITVKFKLKGEESFLLAWTTTPWTLISNLALAVGPGIDYVQVRDKATGELLWLAEARLPAYFKKQKGQAEEPFEVLASLKGEKLAGKSYEPLFPYFKDHANAFRVFADSYVTTEDGTGIVHQAPAYGEDDFRVCRRGGIELVDPLDEEARFRVQIPEYAGQFCKDADKEIIKRLKAESKLFRQDVLVHSYPFCERTDTPLIYRAIPAWYVAVEKLNKDLVANNQKINWVPGHLKDGRMGKWLENARDWAISRNRFWGTPLPIWECRSDQNHIRVFGDVASLEQATGQKIDDLHKHFIDEIEIDCPSCKSKMRRVPEVFDCWFESGSMPYAQLHYPFENKDRFARIFPADFIAEGLDQTRGWFYTLSVLSTALFNRPAFKNVVVNGIICDETGRKMSKRHRNYTPPEDLLNKYGADSVRLYMLNSPILRGEDLIFSDRGVLETTRAVILPLWNAHSFLTTYAAADGWKPDASLAAGKAPAAVDELDRWILSRLQSLGAGVHEQMEKYHLYAVIPLVISFIEDLTNWYIRLSRRRFWGGAAASDDDEGTASSKKIDGSEAAGSEKGDPLAYATLFHVLCEFVKIFAPFAPFVSERIYQNLTSGLDGVAKSIHLTDMPMPVDRLIDRALEERMELVRRVTNLGRSLRAKHQIKTRQVLPSILVITRNESDRGIIEAGATTIRQELNIKAIDFSTDEARFVRLGVKPNLRTLGKRLGGHLNAVRTHLDKVTASHDEVALLLARIEKDGSVEVAGFSLTEEDFLIERGPKDDRLIATEKGVTVLLDTRLSEELLREGLAREVINRIQRMRKDSGLNVSDRIRLTCKASGRATDALRDFGSYISDETLATSLEVGDNLPQLIDGTPEHQKFLLEGGEIEILLAKA